MSKLSNFIRNLLRFELLPADPADLVQGDLFANGPDTTLRYHNGTSASRLVTASHSATLTNKTVVVSANTITTAASGNLSSVELNAALAELQSDIDTRQTAGNYITALTGDVTAAGPGSAVSAIGANKVTSAMIRQSVALALVGNSTNATANVADITAGTDGNIMRRNGTTLGFGSINLALTAAVGSSILPLANGGTGAALVAANGAIPYSTGTVMALLAPGSSGQVLLSGGAGAPTWGSSLTNPMTTRGDVITGAASGVAQRLALGAAGTRLRSDGTDAVWSMGTNASYSSATTMGADVELAVCSAASAAFTLTLPTVVANKQIRIIKDSTVDTTFNQITLGAVTTLNTPGEVVTLLGIGSAWVVVHRAYPEVATSYTPVIKGSTSDPTRAASGSEKCTWTRKGMYIMIQYNYTQTATTSAANGSGTYIFGLPSGLTYNSAVINADTTQAKNVLMGSVYAAPTSATEATGVPFFYTNGSTIVGIALTLSVETGGVSQLLGSTYGQFATNAALTFSFTAMVPITGWN